MSGAENLHLPPDVHGAQKVPVIDGQAERLALAEPESSAHIDENRVPVWESLPDGRNPLARGHG